MGFNLYFDIAALTILSFLIFSIILKKQIIGISNKIYLGAIAITLLTTVLDILASLEFFSIQLLFVLNTFFVFFRAATALMFLFYALNLAKMYHRLKKAKWAYLLIFTPLLILLVFLIINFFNKCLFDYLEGPAYVRGPLMWIAYAAGYFYIVSALLIVIISRKYYLNRQVIALFAAFVMQVGAQTFQFFVGSILVEMFVTALTLLTLSLFIESPEHFIDYKTKALNYHAFTTDIQQQLDVKMPFNVIFIKVTNVATLYNLYPQKQALVFNRSCNSHLVSKARKLDKTSLVYFLGNSTFAYVFSKRELENEMITLINEEFSKPMVQNNISFQFVAKTCLINCPEDCHNVGDLVGFSNTFYELSEDKYLDIKPYRKEKGNLLFELDHILERAINEKSFAMHYQGIYSIKEERFIAAEALIRLKNPDFGTIMPSLMIPYAESRGKSVGIGLVVIEKVFSYFASSLRGKIDYVEINISPMQLADQNFSADVARLADKYGIVSKEIVFEILESVESMEDPNIENNMKQLRDQGYQFAIDDFGTGFSNLSRIMNLDASIIKFDKTMSDLLEDDEHDDFFLGLLPIFRKRKIKILFEGVETKEVVDKLVKMKVDHIQGYYYSKPMPEEEFLTLLGQK